MSHPALMARWRWRPARMGHSGAAHAAAGYPGPARAGAADAGPADAVATHAGAAGAGVAALDARRRLQLLLAGLWLLDGVLQLQPVMFTRRFPAMLAESAAGQPGVVAAPVTWAARLIAGHPAPANAAFAALQIALGLGLAWRPAVRPALAGSVIWGLSVWWLGEGLGGLFTGTASPAGGAPGAALLYAVTAVLLWPPRPEVSSPPGARVIPGQPDPARHGGAGNRPGAAGRGDGEGGGAAGARAEPGQPDPACPDGAGNGPEVAGRSDAESWPTPAGRGGAVSQRPASRLIGMAGGRRMAGGGGAADPDQPDAARLVAMAGGPDGVDGGGRTAAGQPVPFVAGQAIGVRAAAVVWLVLWGALATLALQPAVRAPHAFGGLLADLAGDAPGWLARADQEASAALGGHGLVASVLLAVLMAAIGVAGCRPDRAPAAARSAVAVAVALGLATAATGGFGELFTGMATDPGTGPVLALFALTYWPSRLALTASAEPADPAGSADAGEPAGPRATRARPGSSGSSVTPASPGPQTTTEGAGSWG